MKALIPISAIILTAIVKCTFTTPATLAYNMYERYADHSDRLLVAYVGDYEADGFTYQTLVLQARDSTEWVWLRKEFGIDAFNDVTGTKTTLSDNAANGTASIVSSDGNIKVYLRRAVDNPDTSLVLRPGKLGTGKSATDSTAAPRRVPSLRINITPAGQQRKSSTHGYVMGCDENEQALCLLFYTNLTEEQHILSQIRKSLS